MKKKAQAASLLTLALYLFGQSAPARACTTVILDRISNSIQANYGSREVAEVSDVRLTYPQRNIEAELDGRGFNVRLSFDPDTDRELTEVSRSYSIKPKQGNAAWRLYISGVGHYVALFRLRGEESDRRVESIPRTRTTPLERVLLSYVRDLGYTVLDVATLKCSTHLNRVGDIQASATTRILVWQGLFRWEDVEWLMNTR